MILQIIKQSTFILQDFKANFINIFNYCLNNLMLPIIFFFREQKFNNEHNKYDYYLMILRRLINLLILYYQILLISPIIFLFS